MADQLTFLYESLTGRHRPEEILGAIGSLPAVREAMANLAADLASARRWGRWGWSSMSSDFDAPKPPIRLARSLLERADLPHLTDSNLSNPAVLRGMLLIVWEELGFEPGRERSWRSRPTRAELRDPEFPRGIRQAPYGRRAYNRVVRLALYLERELEALEHQQVLFELGRVAKTVFAAKLPEDEFRRDELTAALVAYVTANLGRRSLFIAGPQARAFDEVAEAIVERLQARADDPVQPQPNWFAIAHVHPAPEVLSRLEPTQVTVLLGHALETMRVAGLELQRVYEAGQFNLGQMVVERGQDSSTWNASAGGWNKARQVWLACMAALGREDSLDRFLPGKVMRLMAADVAAWHRSRGGAVDPDTAVWANLPKPWHVLFGTGFCGRRAVEDVCRRHGVDPIKSGWSRPRSITTADVWRPTPETVHGVVVADPALAVWLRRIGVFSGKAIRLEQVAAFEAKFGRQAAFAVRRQLEQDGGAYAVGAEWAAAVDPAPVDR